MKDKKTKTCDACEEEWEESFFCEKCSRGGRHEEVEAPNMFWDGYPGEECVMEEEWIPNGDICLNCCTCHFIKDQNNTEQATALDCSHKDVHNQ